jgi:hypothetical protein
MPNARPFPSKEADFNVYVQAAVPYLISNKERLLISDDNLTSLTNNSNAWNLIFPASQNTNTRTKTIVENKDIAKVDLMGIMRKIFADIPQSALTTEDRNTLNLPLRDTTRTPAPVPDTRPAGQVDTSQRLRHKISFVNQDNNHAKPEGVRGCQIWYTIGEPVTDLDELKFMALDTASPYIKDFSVEQAGKMVYYWLRWENTRGEVGPWSEVITATITG